MLNEGAPLSPRFPKAELHVHLDGSLRPATMLELSRERGVPLPVEDAEALASFMRVSDARDLEDYLRRFELTLRVMQDAASIERIAYELAVDHADEGVTWVEVRFCPALNTRRGLASNEVLDAALAGLARAERARPIGTALIVCALRTFPAPHSVEMAELAIAYAHRGVVAFDLAGGEAGHPVRDHAEAFLRVRAAGLPVTIHAGEAAGAESIREALDVGGAVRIGHGTRLVEDPALMARVRDEGVTLEVCLTSNVQTRVASSYRTHPLRRFMDEGLSLTLCTDNRLVSGVTLEDEYAHARDDVGLTEVELTRIARNGFVRGFATEARRKDLLAAFDRAVGAPT